MNVINLDKMDKEQAKEKRQKLLFVFSHKRTIENGDLKVSVNDHDPFVYFSIGEEVVGIEKSTLPVFLAAIQALVDEE